MAKVFKGFKQVTEGSFEAVEGYIYFVRNSANTGATDGYLQFNGKKYGTAAELEADVNAKIGTLPEGYSNVVDFVNGQLSSVTDNFSSESVTGSSNGVEVEIGQADGNVTAVTVTAPDFAATYAPISLTGVTSAATRLEAIEADYLKAADKTELEGTIGTLSGRVDAIETGYTTNATFNAYTAATDTALGAVSGRVDDLEAIDADNRLDALESVSADTRLVALEEDTHTHANKDVLDGITQEKVNQWDGMSSGASVVLSAYTDSTDPAATSGMLKTYEIFQGGVSVGKIDIPKDLVVTSGVVTANTNNEKVLRLTIANQDAPVDILVSDLAHVYSQGNGIEISASDEISAKVVNANGLSVDANGIAMAAASDSNAGAMSAADFTKLGTIAASAQTNVIETVKVDGTALTVTNKEVNIELPDYSETYAPLSLTGTVTTNRTAFDNYTAATDTRLDTIESGYTQSATFDAYTAATDNALTSADTRLDALEEISGASHTHSNKTVLDGVTAEKVAAWDDAADKAHEHSNKAVLDGITAEKVSAWDGVAGSADTRIAALEASASTWNGVADSADTRLDALEAVDADTRLDALEAVSADTRLDALEAVSAQTSSALQSISAGDASVSVGTKDSNKNQTVAVARSAASGNTLELKEDGLFAAIYYDGDDSN